MRPSKISADAVGAGLVEAFRQSGFAGASLRSLKQATGLNPASLYYRFPAGKADMAGAAIAHAATEFAPLVIAPLRGDGPATARLAKSAAGVAAFYQSGRLACLLAILSMSSAPPPVLQQVAAVFAEWQTALAETLAAVGVAAADDAAADRIAAIQGALILARSGLGTGSFDRAVAALGAQ